MMTMIAIAAVATEIEKNKPQKPRKRRFWLIQNRLFGILKRREKKVVQLHEQFEAIQCGLPKLIFIYFRQIICYSVLYSRLHCLREEVRYYNSNILNNK